MSTIRNENNQPGFCESRLRSLETFRFCLPPGFKALSRMPEDKQLEALIKYVDQIDENRCRDRGGHYKKMNDMEIDALKSGNNEFNVFYRKFALQMRNQYKESLKNLLKILELLENETTISNSSLNDISNKAKEYIDDMYTKCEMNYIYAIMAYFRADIDTTEEIIKEEKEVINTLQKAIV